MRRRITLLVRHDTYALLCGGALGLSCNNIAPSEARYILPYTDHYKPELLKKPNKIDVQTKFGTKKTVEGWGGIASPIVINWPRYCARQEGVDFKQIISEMNNDDRFSIYYTTTLNFYDYAMEKGAVMKHFEDQAPPTRVFSVLDI